MIFEPTTTEESYGWQNWLLSMSWNGVPLKWGCPNCHFNGRHDENNHCSQRYPHCNWLPNMSLISNITHICIYIYMSQAPFSTLCCMHCVYILCYKPNDLDLPSPSLPPKKKTNKRLSARFRFWSASLAHPIRPFTFWGVYGLYGLYMAYVQRGVSRSWSRPLNTKRGKQTSRQGPPFV